ncbi:MAG: HAD family phosphatase [Planctomycetota bacterium]
MNHIGFVYFDLGNILMAFDRQIACRNVAGLFGGDSEQADAILHTSGLQNELETGRISEEGFARVLHQRYRPTSTVPVDDILHAISDMFTPVPMMAEVIASVREFGLPVGILSNTCRAHWDHIQSMEADVMRGPFDVEVVSFQVGSMKPDDNIYHVAAQRAAETANVDASQILFLDDRDENVSAAKSHGWNAETCLGGPEAIEALGRHGIDIPMTRGFEVS